MNRPRRTLGERKLAPLPAAPAPLRVVPKGPRPSGPTRVVSLEVAADAAGLLGPRCHGCGRKIIAATGKLVHGKWCGSCWDGRCASIEATAPLPPCERPETPDEPPQHAA